MALAPGTRIGPYEVTVQIGKGGMGEVFRGLDTNLSRQVAIKVLPDTFAHDPERLARFEREAKTLAALNHPNIAQIYGLEKTDGIRALVMELVEGPTLADRIAQGAIPIGEALPIAKQIAEALEAAHEQSIIHRDLKPANIKLRPDGTVKVLDFGLAKALEPVSAMGADGTALRTITSPAMTRMGVILGTAAYMSPEQAAGKAVDRRSDLWAFGVVLVEMLTGRPVFAGETVSHVVAAVLKDEPDWRALPANTPASIRTLLRRCLEKDRKRRLDSAADARVEIEDAISLAKDDRISPPTSSHPAERRWRVAAVVSLVAFGASVATLAWRWHDPTMPSDPPEIRLQIITPPSSSLADFAISPDGRGLVFQAAGQLWLRPLESETAQALAGTENGIRPFWSPDSGSVGFFAGGQLKRLDVTSGLVQVLAAAPVSNGGAWNSDGVILFGRSSTGPIYRTRAGGGEVAEATRVDPRRSAGHRFPHFLPDGRHFLFLALGPSESRGLWVGSLDSPDVRRLFDAESAGVFAPPDHVLFARQGALVAQRLNLKTFESIGDPLPLAGQVVLDSIGASYVGAGAFGIALSASAAGPVAYRPAGGTRQLVWLDRAGRHIGMVGAPDAAGSDARSTRLSPDGRYVALDRIVNGNRDVWLLETDRGLLRRFTFDAARDTEPIWSPDASRLVFASFRNGLPDFYEKPVAGGEETVVFSSPEFKNIYDWSPDGRFISYATQTSETGRDLWALPLFGDRQPLAIAKTPSEEALGRFAPDSRWIAYVSNESGRVEVYVQPFPGPGAKLQISTTGGTRPQWRRGGRELFYRVGDRVMAVPIVVNGSTIKAGTAVTLFSMATGSEYTASLDGQRFLISQVTEQAAPITVLLNWKPPGGQ